jgi:hypothetical protein
MLLSSQRLEQIPTEWTHMNTLRHTNLPISTGYWGIPGSKVQRDSTKVHLVKGGKPVCGAKLRPNQRYQWCAYGILWEYIECKRCKRIAEDLAVGAIEAIGETRCPIR